MSEKVLVAYASKHGSTAALAGALARGLRERGVEVDLLDAAEVRALEPYDGVVVGSAVYMGRWRPTALRLLRRERRALAERLLWLFSSGPVGEQPPDTSDPKADRWLRPSKVQGLARTLGAREHVVFGGMIAEGGGFMRSRMAQSTPAELRDLRDWQAVDDWAGAIAASLGAVPLR